MPTTSSNLPPTTATIRDDPGEQLPESPPARSSRMAAVGISLPLIAVIALLVWGFTQAEFTSSGIAINNDLGVIPIKPRPATDFTITTFDGESLSLSDLDGKVVMIDFWASWCPPCRREAPELVKVYELYRGKPVEFIGIDVWDERRDALAYIERYKIQYPNGPDTGGLITVEYGVGGIPEKLFVDRSGTLVKKIIGPMDSQSLIKVIDELLETPLPDALPTP